MKENSCPRMDYLSETILKTTASFGYLSIFFSSIAFFFLSIAVLFLDLFDGLSKGKRRPHDDETLGPRHREPVPERRSFSLEIKHLEFTIISIIKLPDRQLFGEVETGG